MATTPRHTRATETTTTTQTFDLRADFGIDVPSSAARVAVELRRCGGYEIVVERTHTWIVEGQHDAAALTGVYNDDVDVPLPERVPDWLRRVLDNVRDVQIREVTVFTP